MKTNVATTLPSATRRNPALRRFRRLIALIERRSWKLHRAGGAVIGFALLVNALVVPTVFMARRSRARRGQLILPSPRPRPGTPLA